MSPRREWQVQEAKNKLSEVLRRACEEGPQGISVRGEEAVVVVRAVDRANGEELAGTPKRSLAEFFLEWADRMEGIELEIPPRLPDPVRPNPFADAEE